MTIEKWTHLFVAGLVLVSTCRALDAAGQTQSTEGEATPMEMVRPTYVDVSESVVMLQNERVYGSNLACLVTDEGLVFVDCGLFTEIAARFRTDMETRFQKKAIALLLTHAHTDHFFGMAAFADVPVVAAAAEKPLFEYQLSVDFPSRVEAYQRLFPLFGEALKTAEPFLPTRWFDDEITFGREEPMVVIRRTGGHTSGCASAVMASEKVLVAGDNVQVDAYPYFGDASGNMQVWIQTLEEWEKMGLQKICPGHGRVVDGAYLTAVREYFEQLVATLTRLKSEGVPLQDAVSNPDLPKGYWPEGLEKPAWFDPAVAGLYRSLDAD